MSFPSKFGILTIVVAGTTRTAAVLGGIRIFDYLHVGRTSCSTFAGDLSWLHTAAHKSNTTGRDVQHAMGGVQRRKVGWELTDFSGSHFINAYYYTYQLEKSQQTKTRVNQF